MRKLFLLALFVFSAPLCWADASSAPDSCVITIESVLLKNLQGDWIKIISPDKQVDIANYEARVSFFNREGRIPEGDYVNVKIVLSETVKISGRVNRPNDFNFTKEGGEVRVVGDASNSGSLPGRPKLLEEKTQTWTSKPEEKGEVRVHLDLNRGDANDTMDVTASSDFEKPLHVSPGAFINVIVALDLDGSLRYAWQDDYAPGVPHKSVMYFMPQKNPESVKIRVGEQSLVLDQQHVKISF